MRPGGRYDRTSYRDSRPGRHATRGAVLADALDEAADELDGDDIHTEDLTTDTTTRGTE